VQQETAESVRADLNHMRGIMGNFVKYAAAFALLVTASVAQAASPPELINKGEYVARAGDCIVCHTGPREKEFAGGLKMGTPVGPIYTTNITPDKETGIGNYTFEDFDRAMRKGIAKDGHRLFPAMPFPSYANMTEDDMKALYAYFMEGVKPVKRANTAHELPWPINGGWMLDTGLAAWSALFVHVEPYKADPNKDAVWNRGAYLVEGLGHCGSCHTPRGIFFQEKAMNSTESAFLSGAELDYWSASNLRGEVGDGLGAWTEADVAQFLKTGRTAHTTAFGTMIDVINYSTQYMTDADLAAMANYIKSLPAGSRKNQPFTYDTATEAKLTKPGPKTAGEQIYVQRCSGCHGLDGKGSGSHVGPLAGNSAILDANPASLINVTLNGSQRIVLDGQPDPYRMVPFRESLTDQQVADVVTFIRGAWGNTAGAAKASDVETIRKFTDPANDALVILRMR